MGYIELEKQLSRKQFKRRMIFGILSIVFIIMCIMSLVLREASKEVIIHDIMGIYSWDEEIYNDNYIILFLPGILGATLCLSFLLVDFLGCRYKTIENHGYYITVYRGMLDCMVFVDGREVGRIEPFSYEHVIETVLPDKTKVVISFPQGKNLWTLVHISFSDNTPSIDI